MLKACTACTGCPKGFPTVQVACASAAGLLCQGLPLLLTTCAAPASKQAWHGTSCLWHRKIATS